MPADEAAIKSTLEVVIAAPVAPQFRSRCVLEAHVFERPEAATYGRRKGRLLGRRHGGCARHGDARRRRAGTTRGRRAPPEVAHACPSSDPCAGSDAAHAWATIGFIAAAGTRGPPWSTKRYVRYVIYR